MREVWALLRERLDQPGTSNLEVVADVGFALRELREAGLPKEEGSRAVLADLEKQAETAEATLAPEDVKRLIDSLRTFVSDQLNSTEEGGNNMNDNSSEQDARAPDTGADPQSAKDQRDPQKTMVTCEACGHQQEAASTGSVPSPVGETDGPDTGGVNLPTDSKDKTATQTLGEADLSKEDLAALSDLQKQQGKNVYEDDAVQSDPSKDGKLSRGAPPVAAREADRALNRRDRALLDTLVERERQRDLFHDAQKVIREAGVDLDPQKLATFEKRQWSTLIDMAGPVSVDGGVPASLYGAMRESAQRQSLSRAEQFSALFDE